MSYIPFNRPCAGDGEMHNIKAAITNLHLSGDGPFSEKCHQLIQNILGSQKVLLTTSCTHALEMAAFLLEIKPGDEVIVPSFTFVSTANAFVIRGARPVFIDVRPDTLNLDETQLERLITPRTRAIVPVHYAGVGCQMDTILEIAGRFNIPVIEDNAHGFLGKFKGKSLGSFGAMATQSFHETKNISCGEGGALVINDPRFSKRAEIIREKGTNRSQFFRGEVENYSWIDVGSSYLPSDILAAFLYAQLETRDRIHQKRRLIWEYYFKHLADWAAPQGVKLPHVPGNCELSYYMFYLVMPSLAYRHAMIRHLEDRKIHSVFHYLPLHLSLMGRKFGGKEGDCPVTEQISDRLVRLPFFNDLTQDELSRIVGAVTEFSV